MRFIQPLIQLSMFTIAVTACTDTDSPVHGTSTDPVTGAELHSAQSSDWSVPVNLGPIVNSPFNDVGGALSKDGLSLYFGSNRPTDPDDPLLDNNIWVAQRPTTSSPWGAPVPVAAINTADFIENIPALSRDGHWLFFNSDRPGGFGDVDIWVSYRSQTHDDFGWEPPRNLGAGVNSAFFDAGAAFFENDDVGVPLLFFGSNRPGGQGGNDIYVSEQLADGSFGAVSVVAEVSSPQDDQRPAVSPDGLELFLFSSRVGAFGVTDIWVSTRDTVADPWSLPVNLGSTVNSTAADFQPYLASDRTTLLFSSLRPGGFGGLDLYETTRSRK